MNPDYRLKSLHKRTDEELLWFYYNSYPQMLKRREQAKSILISRGIKFKERIQQ